jgi:hypothetical protein
MARIRRGLIDAMRRHGLNVIEVSGCWGRGGDSFSPVGVIAHATAGSSTARDRDELNVILNGSNTAPPPISQFMLGRDGTWYFVADGRCNHARTGWGGPFDGQGNGNLIGIEGCNNNVNEPWHSYASYVRGVAVILSWYGWNASRVAGHKEHQPGDKSDPTFNMNTFRADVTREIAALQAPAVPAEENEDEDMGILYHVVDTEGTQVVTDDKAVFAYLGGGTLRVSKVAVPQSLANKLALPPAAPDKGTGNSSALTHVEWNALLDWFDVDGYRADASGNVDHA